MNNVHLHDKFVSALRHKHCIMRKDSAEMR